MWTTRILTRIVWSIRFNRIAEDNESHPAVILKRRSALGRLSAMKGHNRRRAPLPRILVMPDRAWAEREQFMYRKLHGLTVECDASGTLRLPRLSGRTLATILQEDALNQEEQSALLESVIRALAELHALRTDAPGDRGAVSHADASAKNIMISDSAGEPAWFDFDIAHELQASALRRRTDDLRAAVFSIASMLPADAVPDSIRLMLSVYPHADVRQELKSWIRSGVLRWDPLHRCHACIRHDHHALCSRIIMELE